MGNKKIGSITTDYGYLNQARNHLNLLTTQESHSKLKGLRKNFATAAIIALASGTTLLFSTHTVKADETNDATVQKNEPATTTLVQKTDEQQANAQQNAPEQPGTGNQLTDQLPEDQKSDQQTAGQTQAATSQTSGTDQSVQANTNNFNLSEQTNEVVKTEVPETTSALPKDAAKKQAQTDDQAGQKDANGVELPANNQDHIKGNVQDAWDQGYKGQHIVVAVIDSGVDTSHKDFQKMPEDPKLTQDQMEALIKKLGYGTYVNLKFPFVYNAVDHENQSMKGPNDEPHGQHVSGIIAADGQPDGDQEYVVGVAPEAQLMHFKVFGDDATSLDIAQEIYDATNLGADVIQMSLGGGVAAADLNVADQRAVQYAIDHGVIVSISASNNGNAASVQNPSNVTDLDNYEAGTNAGNYEPFSSSTIADPGAARGAITGAAETSGLGEDSDMASFTSWGPLPDFTLKPDVSAPGNNVISLANDDGYTTMSGTSMAGPFIAGAAALVKQRLQQTNPELKGADLVAAVKALLMNTADPQIQQGFSSIVSPRRQGAGQINVGAATKAPVYILANDGTGSVSLENIKESTNFELTFHNLTDNAETYTFGDLGGGFTEVRDADTGLFHDVQLAGAQVTGPNSITVNPNETKKVAFTLNLIGLKQNQLVEGYLKFTNTNDNSVLSVPYLGYYGDMTSEDVFDKKANEDKPDIKGSRLTNEDNYPRGIADEESLKELVNIEGQYNWQEVAKLYESGKVAFSPNGDNKSDLIMPYVYLKQNLQDLKVEILDAKGDVVRVLADAHGVQKSYNADGSGTVDALISADADKFNWDGKIYNSKTGKMEVAPDGQYTYRFVATLYNDGPHKVQTNDTPVIIDTTAPVLQDVKYDDATKAITGTYSDTGAGFTNYSYVTVTINDQVFGFKLNDGANSNFDNEDKTKGHFTFALTDAEQQALTAAHNKVSVALSDVADNTVVKTLDVAGVNNGAKIAVWNAINGEQFNTASPDYNSKDNNYLLRGSATDNFYLNGKLVQVDQNGEFVVPVSLAEQSLVFSIDENGQNLLAKFSTYTPKADFAWQHVDGSERSFGVSIYSIDAANPNDAVVQAAVPKGDNVKAFAKDYFTGEVYVGEVKDGVATFHVHTSINQDSTTGIYRRALLQGWVEIDGPTFNAKQKTDPTAINNRNYIGVCYKADAKPHVYSKRDNLGVADFTDEQASVLDFGPGQYIYPSHDAPSEGNPDISFDYVNDNNTSTFGQEAVKSGYYDPTNKVFTITGHVDKNVVGLVALQDNPNEDAPENKVSIGDDGSFTIKFHMDDPATRELTYIYEVKDPASDKTNKVRGSITLVLDTVLPTLHVDQLNGADNLTITTNKPTFKISGNANDDLDDYGVYINGDNVFTQFNGSSLNYIPGMYGDPNQKTPNLYGSYDFAKEVNLDDDNGKPTTHVFTIEVVDQVGNKVVKTLTVNYDPNAVESEEPSNGTGDNGIEVLPTVPRTVQPLSDNTSLSNVKTSDNLSSDQQALTTELTITLPRNVFAFDHSGKVAKRHGKDVIFKKGVVLHNPQEVTIKNLKYYQVGENVYVKVPSTVANKKLKRLVLIKNSYVYNLKGKVNKVHHKRILLKKGTNINVLHDGKITKIGKHDYYQIGTNQYVKVVNTALK